MPARVLVTRPEIHGGPLTDAVRAAGCEPVAAPGFAYAPADNAPGPDEVAAADWVAWTSAAAVEAVRPDATGPTRHAAVGGATAAALRERGIEPAIVGAGGGAQLAELLIAQVAAGETVLYPRSAKADGSFTQRLSSFGIVVVDRVAYRLGPADADRIRAALADGVDAVTFASPSAVAGFADALSPGPDGADPVAALDGIVLASIGATTSGSVRARLRPPDVEAPEPTFTALATATAAALHRR